MAYEKQKRLVEILFRRSREGKVEWQTAIVDNAFQVAFRDNTVEIRQLGREIEDEYDYRFTLRNSEGEVAERFTDIELYADVDGEARKQGYMMASDLFEMARRKATGADKIIDSILEDLDDDDIPF
jgi:hypothetical protein